ncbi:Protein kinase domain containing protein [Brugia malayi]|uniref:mitogen-activated protein kinase kinase kinase n=3 Tax=Brugia TaxID=6278 RepID=A0A0J9XRC5_BRUMA|nr:Protein kinase domain containing protein [Brugia malayi]CDP93664.1 BMA-MLK-1, isoform b [Brugia malayi]VIO99233.1 Protein kinase domain containing protein [Brugia malayi]
MESPETPVAPTLFRPLQPMIIGTSSGTAHAPGSIHFQKALLPKTFVNHPSTSRACTIESLTDNVPDRPEIFSQPKRKSRSVADIFASIDSDNNDVRFRHDDMKPQKSLVVESNYDYTPKRKDELKLKRGATIKVIRRDGEEGWWYGEKLDGSGKKGFFPQNHVQLAKGLAKEIDPNDIQFTGLLGAGGFSVVKSAIYKRREVAVKIPHSKFSKKEILEAVREEASIFQMLDHGNIVEMYGVIVGDEPALVLELCRDSLAKICSSKKNISLSEEIISNWGIQVARGMSYLHSLNVLHRDLKAANVLIKEKVCDCLLNVEASNDEQLAHSLQAKNGVCHKCGGSALNCLTLKIADLGLSKKLRVADCRMSVVGTVPYLAPEVIRDRKCSKAMDVWSFGLVLWEVLTGATPFEGLGPGAVQLQIGTFVKQKIPSSCPPDLRLIIESCWRDDPLQRPTFKELIVELEKFGIKFRTTDPHDQTFLENSLNTLRKSMMEEISSIASEMARKAEELQKREENLKKGERELKLKTMIFELQQTLSERPPKEKPQPPKRRQHLKCEDISKPYDLKTEISLTKNMQMIESLNRDVGTGTALNDIRINGSTDQLSLVSNSKCVDDTCLGFATLPRIPKKFTLKTENFDCVESSPVQQRGPSKSTPDLLKLYRLPVHNASPKLKRVNACKVKRESTRTSAEEEVDERCVEVINDKDLESLLETTAHQQTKTFLDHLATPRRVVQLPPSTKNLAADHMKSTSTADERARSKLSKEEDRGFFRSIFKRDTKDRSGQVAGTFPKSMIARSPLGPSTIGPSAILKNITPSKHTRIKSPTKPSPTKAGKKKKYSTGTESNKYDLTENSKTFTKSGERRISATPSQTSAVYPVSSSPVSVYCSSDELYSAKRAPYEKLSEASDPGMMENPLYILPKNFPPRGRASTSTSRIFFNTTQRSSKSPSFSTSCDGRLSNNGLSTIENLSYKPPNEMKVSCNTLTQITLDSPVEGGLDIDATKHSVNSLNSESASFCDDSSFFIDRSLRGITLNVSNSYIPMSATEQNLLSISPPFLDHCNDQKESFVLGDAIHHISESAQGPPEIQAPALPGAAVGYRPQRPYTLDLTSPPTPAESGISTAGSSYRSFSSVDQGLQDHAPPTSVDSVPHLAPPIPPRNIARRPEDEALQRQRLSPVSQSP